MRSFAIEESNSPIPAISVLAQHQTNPLLLGLVCLVCWFFYPLLEGGFHWWFSLLLGCPQSFLSFKYFVSILFCWWLRFWCFSLWDKENQWASTPIKRPFREKIIVGLVDPKSSENKEKPDRISLTTSLCSLSTLKKRDNISVFSPAPTISFSA